MQRSIGNDIEQIKIDNSEDLRLIMIEDDSIIENKLNESKKYSFISSWVDNPLLKIYAKDIKVLWEIIKKSLASYNTALTHRGKILDNKEEDHKAKSASEMFTK